MCNGFDKHLSSAIVDRHLIALFLQTHCEISTGGTNMLDIYFPVDSYNGSWREKFHVMPS